MKLQKGFIDFPIVFFKENFHIEEFLKKQLTDNEADYIIFDGNLEILESLSLIYPKIQYVLIKNSNYKCKNSFEYLKAPLIHPFIGFEDIEFKTLSSNNDL